MKKFLSFLELRFYWVLLGLFILSIIFMPFTGLSGDFEAFSIWAKHMAVNGLLNVYAAKEANYWPPFMYMLNGFRLLFNNFASFQANIYYFKIPFIVFDFASIALIGWLLKRLKRPAYLAFLILINPAFFYDSWIWGQIESMYIFFTLAAIIAAIYNRTVLSLIFYTVAFYSKLQAVIFLPGLLLLLLPQICKNPKLILHGLISVLATQVVLLFPFILSGQIIVVYKAIMTSIDYLPYITVNAFNFWALLLGTNGNYASDKQPLLLLSYKTWGIILFCLSSAFILWKQFWGWIKKPRQIPEVNIDYVFKVFLITALIAMVFYYFPTQMHDRYLQPAILLFGLVYILKPSKLIAAIYLLISIAYFINLERSMHFLQLPIILYKLMSARVFAIVNTVGLGLAFFTLYKKELVSIFKTKKV